jgi:hypothetical protein
MWIETKEREGRGLITTTTTNLRKGREDFLKAR